MQVSKEKLNQFLSLPDDEIKAKITEAAMKNGIPSAQLAGILGNVASLKKMLSGLSEKDLNKVVSMVGDTKLAQMINDMQ